MADPISEDLRLRIVAAWTAGGSTYDEIAARLSVGRAWVSRVLRRHRERGTVEPEPHGGGMPARIRPEKYGELREFVLEQPDRSVRELTRACLAKHRVMLSRSAMQRTIHRAGLSWTTYDSGPPSSSEKTSSRSARQSPKP